MPIRHHHIHYHLPRMTEMKRLFFTHSIGATGAGMVGIFVPLYLLTLGYSFSNVVLYLLIQQGAALLLIYPAMQLLSRFGANKGIVIGQVSTITYFSLLLTLPHFHWPLAFVAIWWAVDRVSYATAIHANFSRSRAHEKTGTQLSWFSSIVTVAHGLAPAVGGIIATEFGISWVYGAGIGLLLISLIPMIGAGEITTRRSLQLSRLDYRRLWRDPVSNAFNGATSMAELLLWPMIIFFIVKTYAGVGILSSLVLIASIAVALFVGKREETKGETRYLHRGLGLETLTNIFRALASNALHVFGVNLINGVSRSMYTTPYMTRYYKHADEEPRMEYITLMEAGQLIGCLALLGAVYLISLHWPRETTLLIGVLLAAPASFGTRLIR
jgi:MFS family permease